MIIYTLAIHALSPYRNNKNVEKSLLGAYFPEANREELFYFYMNAKRNVIISKLRQYWSIVSQQYWNIVLLILYSYISSEFGIFMFTLFKLCKMPPLNYTVNLLIIPFNYVVSLRNTTFIHRNLQLPNIYMGSVRKPHYLISICTSLPPREIWLRIFKLANEFTI